MKKLLLMMLMVLTTGVVAQAQVALGVKAGVSSSSIDVKNLKNSVSEFKAKDDITGYHAGAFLRLRALGLMVQPEAILTSSGGTVNIFNSSNGTVDQTEKFKFNRLDVPLLVGYSLFNVVRVQAGPVASTLISGKLGDQNLKNQLDKTDWGWQAGVGFDIGNLTTDLRYENVNRNYTNQNTSFDIGNKQVILSLGFKILGK